MIDKYKDNMEANSCVVSFATYEGALIGLSSNSTEDVICKTKNALR